MAPLILILEDDVDLREALLMTLEDEDYQAHAAATGLDALNLATHHRFDIAVADVRMEGIDGIEVLGTLKKLNPTLHCIVMTGYADEEAPTRALQIQVEDYIYKPFRGRDLIDTIERLQNRVREQATYDGLFGRVLEGYRALMQKAGTARLTVEQTHVDAARHAAFRNFYVGVRSGKVHPLQGIQVWDLFEQAERRREEVWEMTSPPIDAYRKLHQGYRTIADMIGALSYSTLPERPRGPGQVPSEVFEAFYRKIRAGQLSLEQVKTAPTLRLADAVRRSTDAELRALLAKVWQTP